MNEIENKFIFEDEIIIILYAFKYLRKLLSKY